MATIRNQVRERAKDLIGNGTLAADLEVGIFNKSIQDAKKHNVIRKWNEPLFKRIYMNNARRVITNLDNTSNVKNSRLLERLQDREFAPHEIAFYEPRQMYPEQWKALEDDKMLKQFSAIDVMDEGATDEYRCRKCNQRRCTF